MTRRELESVVLDALSRVAPEIDRAAVLPTVDVREQLDIDSMDFLNFVLALHEHLHVEIPEAEYQRLSTVDGAVVYLDAKLNSSS